MRGYFGIGVERLSKPMNAGNLFRSAHAFGASFIFTIGTEFSYRHVRRADTSGTPAEVPLHEYVALDDLALPKGCRLVGVELTDDAVELPSFRHPRQAAYVLGPERGSLSEGLQERCDFLVQIPTSFCVNVATAGAIVMYDRMISMGRFAERAVRAGGTPIPPPPHVSGGPVVRRPAARDTAPAGRRTRVTGGS